MLFPVNNVIDVIDLQWQMDILSDDGTAVFLSFIVRCIRFGNWGFMSYLEIELPELEEMDEEGLLDASKCMIRLY